MQLVMFIRSLSSEKSLHEKLSEAIFTAFDNTDLLVEHSRIEQFKNLSSAQSLYRQLKSDREQLYRSKPKESGPDKKSVEAYQLELEQLGKLNHLQYADDLYAELRVQIKTEKDNYQSVGALILQNGNQQDIEDYIKLIDMLGSRLQLKDNKLIYQLSESDEAAIEKQGQDLVSSINSQLDRLKKERTVIEGKMTSADRTLALHELDGRIKAAEQLKNRLIASFAEGMRQRQNEKSLVDEISEYQTSKPNGKDA